MRRVISLFRQPQEYLAVLDYDDDPAKPVSEEDFNEEPEYFRQLLEYLREQKSSEVDHDDRRNEQEKTVRQLVTHR
jgi:predicted dienelactone hydrolase